MKMAWALLAVHIVLAGATKISPGLQQLNLLLPEASRESFEQQAAPALKDVLVDRNVLSQAHAAGSGGFAKAVISVDTTGALSVHAGQATTAPVLPVAWASYNNTVESNGWAHLSVTATTDTRVSRELRMYAAGFLEGLLSAMQIRHFQHNTLALLAQDEKEHHAMGNIRDMFAGQLVGILNKSSMLSSSAADRRWHEQARFALAQAWGILDAYNGQVEFVKGQAMSMLDLMVLSSDGETPELEQAFSFDEVAVRDAKAEQAMAFLQQSQRSRSQNPKIMTQSGAEKYWRRIKETSGRCSALVRMAGGGKELYVGHSTFSGYSEMNRIFKYYDLPLGDGVVQKMGFSSYPGVSGSTDDFYLLESGLVVTETTISLLSAEPYDSLHDTEKGIPDFMRIMLANRLAASGQDWVDLMSKSETGTYSSQWMVVDYNQFQPGRKLRNGTLLVLEQIPGLSHSEDMSQHLQAVGYWASENRAWFKDIRDKSGATDDETLYGSLFSADKNPRAQIFAESAGSVETLAEMRSEMRRNKWPYEKLLGDKDTPDHAIAARSDLRKKDPSDNGAVDAKVTNSCLMKTLACDAVSGPSWDDQKPFQWTDSTGRQLFPGEPRDGLPNLWNFDWQRMSASGPASLHGGACPE
mmetsp:Transcript_96359/g.171261  ORF Transcript_96359/g.171261 Transcript_96359/m.171261 type:complete len:638 (-) Transcript_96359:351-2264(-)